LLEVKVSRSKSKVKKLTVVACGLGRSPPALLRKAVGMISQGHRAAFERVE
jgi:hypothetical protein